MVTEEKSGDISADISARGIAKGLSTPADSHAKESVLSK